MKTIKTPPHGKNISTSMPSPDTISYKKFFATAMLLREVLISIKTEEMTPNGYLAPSGTSEIHSRAAPATSSMKKGKDLAVGLQKSPNIHVSKNIYAKYGTSSILPSTNRYTPLSMKWLNVVPKPTNATPNAGRNITKVTRKTKKDGSQKFYKTA